MASSRDKPKSESTREIVSDSVKLMADQIGITAIGEDACKYLADDVTYRLRVIVQDALKIALHSKRDRLSASDVDVTLKMKNFEPVYGFTSADYIPFRNISGGGREIFFSDDKEIDLDDLLSKSLPKIPLQVSVKAHWLAIEGVQPAIPENPQPVNRDLQKLEGVNPISKAMVDKLGKSRSSQSAKKTKDVMIKPLAEHDLSVEQQLYYKEITEVCVGSEENRRLEALGSLAQDPGLHKMLPRFSTFISEGVKINCIQNNLAILIYLMRMLKSLLENPTLYLEKYLHELIPAAVTCVVSKQLCMKPETDNHWALRDFSSKILGQICKKFTSSTNDIQVRIVKVLTDALQNAKTPLSTRYGCISALGELGNGVVQSFLFPIIKTEGDRLRQLLEGVTVNSADKQAAINVKQALIKVVAPTLKAVRKPPDNLETYRQEFGYLGTFLHESVTRLRAQPVTTSASLLNKPPAPGVPALRAQTGVTLLPNQPAAVSRSYSVPGGSRVVPGQPNMIRVATSGSSLVRTPTTPTTPGAAPTSQKFVIVSTTAASSIQPAQSPAQPTIVKVITSAGMNTTALTLQGQSQPPTVVNKSLMIQTSAEQTPPSPHISPDINSSNME